MCKKTSVVIVMVFCVLFLIVVPAHTQSPDLSGYKICLDPGHGGSDPGAVYNAGMIYLEEADINLDVAYGLKALLEADGAAVAMARTDDSYKDNSDRYTYCNDEEATILVSIHTNSVTDPTWDGAMALYFRPDDDDKILAQTIFDEMYPFLKDTAPAPDIFSPFGLDWFASGVLLKSDMPAAMMEPLFMSNPAEAALLVTPIYSDYGDTLNVECDNCRRAQIAQAIYNGVVAYFAPGAGKVMHIESVELTLRTKGVWTTATAEVLVVDKDNNPVNQAIVTGQWSGLANDTDVATTNEDGIAVVVSDRTKESFGEFIFTITDVSKPGWTYISDPEGKLYHKQIGN